jgi:hypothetical protein
MDNLGVHFLEDTFSGPTRSIQELIEQDGKLMPRSDQTPFTPEEALKREYALRAIEDYTMRLHERPAQPADTAIQKLDIFLSHPSQYKHLMVPHE